MSDSDNDGGGHSHALGHAIGLGVLVALIGFAFGKRAAQVFVAGVLLLGALAFFAIGFLVITDRI